MSRMIQKNNAPMISLPLCWLCSISATNQVHHENHWQIMMVVQCFSGEWWMDVFMWILYGPPKPGFRQSKSPWCQHGLHGSEFLWHLSCSSLISLIWSILKSDRPPSAFGPVLWLAVHVLWWHILCCWGASVIEVCLCHKRFAWPIKVLGWWFVSVWIHLLLHLISVCVYRRMFCITYISPHHLLHRITHQTYP